MGFLSKLQQQVNKPLVVILDNASIHKAIQAGLKLLEQRGVTLYFLPTYSPELNRIETLWRMMKHRWLDACHRTKEKLEQDIQHISDNFGRLYTLNFFEKTSCD